MNYIEYHMKQKKILENKNTFYHMYNAFFYKIGNLTTNPRFF